MSPREDPGGAQLARSLLFSHSAALLAKEGLVIPRLRCDGFGVSLETKGTPRLATHAA